MPQLANFAQLLTPAGGHSDMRRGSGRGVGGGGAGGGEARAEPYRHVASYQHTSADVSRRQQTSAYVSRRQQTSAYVSIRQQTSAYVSIRVCRKHMVLVSERPERSRQHTPACASIRQHTRLPQAYATSIVAWHPIISLSLEVRY
jgi:hypothetical protein